MGFGMLLIGYFLANILPVISAFSFAMLLGYPLLIAGLYRLAPYHKKFYYSMWVALPSPLFAMYYTVFGFATVGLLPSFAFLGGTVYLIVEWLYFSYTLLLNFMILWSVASFTGEMNLFSIQSSAWRNLTFTLIYHAVYLIIKLPIPLMLVHGGAFALPVTLLRYLCVFLNLWLFFLCYRNILPEESEAEDTQNKRKEK